MTRADAIDEIESLLSKFSKAFDNDNQLHLEILEEMADRAGCAKEVLEEDMEEELEDGPDGEV